MMQIEELIKEFRAGDRTAGEVLVTENAGLIWSVAKRFLGRGTEADDLYQLGCLGFLKAVEGFDPEFGTRFSTYAVPKIAGEIRRFLRDDGSVKVSRCIKEQAFAIKQAKTRLTNSLGRDPLLSELTAETGLSAEEIAVAESATAATESINSEKGDEGFTLENLLTDSESEEDMVEKITLRQAIRKLGQREATVIRLRYYHGMTQERVSRILKVSQVQISRIEKNAISQLRALMK